MNGQSTDTFVGSERTEVAGVAAFRLIWWMLHGHVSREPSLRLGGGYAARLRTVENRPPRHRWPVTLRDYWAGECGCGAGRRERRTSRSAQRSDGPVWFSGNLWGFIIKRVTPWYVRTETVDIFKHGGAVWTLYIGLFDVSKEYVPLHGWKAEQMLLNII